MKPIERNGRYVWYLKFVIQHQADLSGDGADLHDESLGLPCMVDIRNALKKRFVNVQLFHVRISMKS
eukprot:748888-Hanusia_phi.AAC.3